MDWLKKINKMNKLKIILRIVVVLLGILVLIVGVDTIIKNPSSAVGTSLYETLSGVCAIIVLFAGLILGVIVMLFFVGLVVHVLTKFWKWLWNIKGDSWLD